MSGWPRHCQIFTKKRSWLNSRKRRTLPPSRPTKWLRSMIFILTTSESRKNHRSSRGRWSCRKKPRRKRAQLNCHVERQSRHLLLFNNERFLDSARNEKGLIGLVFFLHRFGSPDFWFPFASLATSYLLPFVNFFKNIGDHRRGSRTAMHFTADIAFVKGGERILRLVGRQKSCEPCRSALFVFRSPLRGPGFSGYFNIIETRLMRCAAGAVYDVDHSGAQFIQRLGREIECSFGAHLICVLNFVIKRLHLLDESGLLTRA